MTNSLGASCLRGPKIIDKVELRECRACALFGCMWRYFWWFGRHYLVRRLFLTVGVNLDVTDSSSLKLSW